MPQANRSTNGSRKLVRNPLVFWNTLRRLAGGAVARLDAEHRDVPGQDDPGLLQRLPQRLPARDRRIAGWPARTSGRPGGPRPWRRGAATPRCAQPGRSRAASARRSAGLAPPRRIRAASRCRRGSRPSRSTGSSVEIWKIGPKMTWVCTPSRSMSASRNSATAGRRSVWSWKPPRSKAVKIGLTGPLVAGGGRLAAPGAPHLVVADPHRLPVALLDMGRAVAQRGRQPLVHRSAGSCPKSMWSSHEISGYAIACPPPCLDGITPAAANVTVLSPQN